MYWSLILIGDYTIPCATKVWQTRNDDGKKLLLKFVETFVIYLFCRYRKTGERTTEKISLKPITRNMPEAMVFGVEDNMSTITTLPKRAKQIIRAIFAWGGSWN